jgi:hypothetical protein
MGIAWSVSAFSDVVVGDGDTRTVVSSLGKPVSGSSEGVCDALVSGDVVGGGTDLADVACSPTCSGTVSSGLPQPLKKSTAPRKTMNNWQDFCRVVIEYVIRSTVSQQDSMSNSCYGTNQKSRATLLRVVTIKNFLNSIQLILISSD